MRKEIKIDYENLREWLRLSKTGWTLRRLGDHFDFTGIYYYTSRGQLLPSWLINEISNLLKMTNDETMFLFYGRDQEANTRDEDTKYTEFGKQMWEVFDHYEKLRN